MCYSPKAQCVQFCRISVKVVNFSTYTFTTLKYFKQILVKYIFVYDYIVLITLLKN